MAIVPTVSAVACTLATWLGYRLYADKLAKISLSKSSKSRGKNVELGAATIHRRFEDEEGTDITL